MTLIFPRLVAVSLLLAADITDAVDCTGKLIRTVSGPSSTCDGFETSSNAHYWPLVDGCHGWKATSVQDGSVHENSANNIRCSDDGTRLLYDQWAGSLDCSNSGFGSTSKEFVWNECHQGIPTRLYDMGINLDCCLDPDGHSCLQSYTGVPRVDGVGTADEEIYWNGERCDDENDNVVTGEEAPTASPTTPPTAVTNNENGRPTDNATGGPGWMIAGWWHAVVSLFNV